jgi:hypothetical protein
MYLAEFLYDLAAIDRREADDFYTQALSSYASAPMERLLYLSAYAFGDARDAGDMPGNTFYRVPSGSDSPVNRLSANPVASGAGFHRQSQRGCHGNQNSRSK